MPAMSTTHAATRPRRPARRHSGTDDQAGDAADPAFAAAHPELAAPSDIVALQRYAGNQAVVGALQRQPARGRRQPPAVRDPTHDEIAAEIGSALGGPYADYAAYTATMVNGTFLGKAIRRGVRQELLTMLQDGEAKIDEEYTNAGKTPPRNETPPGDYGISSVGGFRNSAGFHGWGLAVDIDVARNPFVMHEAGEAEMDRQLRPVYHRIAEFILNDPVGTEHSIIPRIITTMGGLTATSPTGRAARLGEYYDRLLRESEAMREYFGLMNDQTALAAFLTGTWQQRHPQATPPPIADVTRQMWHDFATLGGAVPRGGPPGVAGFTAPGNVSGDRPFNPRSAGQQDPGLGFLTIPREVVIGLGRAVSRWGAIDFGGQSGDIQHFDDGSGLGSTISAAKGAARRKLQAAAAAAAAGQAGATTTSTAQPTMAQRSTDGSGRLRAVQRRTEPGEGMTEGGVLLDSPAAPAIDRKSGAHWKAVADANWPNSTSLADLEAGFSADLAAFIGVLGANGIRHEITAGLRPPERSYLFHWCVKVAKGKVAPKDVPAMAGVDIVWDHGNDAASRAGAQALADAFDLVGIAAHPSNHNGGKAVDMKLDFSGLANSTLTYTKNGQTVTRTIKTDDEARIGVKAKGKTISDIAARELSKAGADFGVKRALDNDIVHWSRTGR